MSANLKSEIAAAQKARARYGKFFTKEKFSQMASCSSLQEVAASIRENPFFTSALQQYKFVIDTVRKGIDSPAFPDQTAFIQIFFELFPANPCAGYVFRI